LTFADADLSYIAPAGGVQSYDLWRLDQITEVAAEFVRQKVDVIVTMGGAVAAFKQATPDLPIVFAIAVDPVGGGLVANLSRPGQRHWIVAPADR
jgi:hypothetical protein